MNDKPYTKAPRMTLPHRDNWEYDQCEREYDQYERRIAGAGSALARAAQRTTYSIAQIVFNDGTTTEFMVKASPSVVPNLTKEMKATGFLTLWNDVDTLCIRADNIKHFSMREVTDNK